MQIGRRRVLLGNLVVLLTLRVGVVRCLGRYSLTTISIVVTI